MHEAGGDQSENRVRAKCQAPPGGVSGGFVVVKGVRLGESLSG